MYLCTIKEKNMLIEIKDLLIKDIQEYCKINNITDWEEVVNSLLYKGFMISKYGLTPFDNKQIEQNGTSDFQPIKKNEQTKPTRVQKTEETPTSNGVKDKQEKELLPQEETKPIIKKTRVIKRVKKNND